jgi:hypothetical protein
MKKSGGLSIFLLLVICLSSFVSASWYDGINDFFKGFFDIGGSEKISGRIEIEMVDNFDDKLSEINYFVRNALNEKYLIEGFGEEKFNRNDLVSIRGRLKDGKGVKRIELERYEVLEIDEEVAFSPEDDTLGEQKTAFIIMEWENGPTGELNQQNAEIVINGEDGLNNFILENSFGKTWIDADFFGPYSVPFEIENCEYSDSFEYLLFDQTIGNDILWTDYDRIIIGWAPFNENCISEFYDFQWSGRGELGKYFRLTSDGDAYFSVIYLNGYLDLRTIAHEFGHNLGAGHANDIECGSESIGGGSHGESGCIRIEYGDTFDIMGNNGGNFGAKFKDQFGWYDDDDLLEVDGDNTGEYFLGMFDGDLSPKAIKFARYEGNSLLGHYYLEQVSGEELIIRYMPVDSLETYLIDTSPENNINFYGGSSCNSFADCDDSYYSTEDVCYYSFDDGGNVCGSYYWSDQIVDSFDALIYEGGFFQHASGIFTSVGDIDLSGAIISFGAFSCIDFDDFNSPPGTSYPSEGSVLIPGNVMDLNSGDILEDSCASESVINEAICGTDGESMKILVQCPEGTACKTYGGVSACFSPENCIDSDRSDSPPGEGDDSIFVPGGIEIVSGDGNPVYSLEDECLEPNNVGESYCQFDGSYGQRSVPCPTGTSCESGACVGFACEVTNGGVEICDGKDNDCDGQIDEDESVVMCGQGYVCDEGLCQYAYDCYENDGGENPLEKGFTWIAEEDRVFDECLSYTSLKEQYCTIDTQHSSTIDCSSLITDEGVYDWCVNGACVKCEGVDECVPGERRCTHNFHVEECIVDEESGCAVWEYSEFCNFYGDGEVCSQGGCVSLGSFDCFDSDGFDYSGRGFVANSSDRRLYDFCYTNGHDLGERYCDGANIQVQRYDCAQDGMSCKGGKCVQEAVEELYCNGFDDDRDGLIDEGDLCGSAQTCVNGECVSDTCSDGDSGEGYDFLEVFDYGVAEVEGGERQSDVCFSGNSISEKYCEGNDVKSKRQSCTYGCNAVSGDVRCKLPEGKCQESDVGKDIIFYGEPRYVAGETVVKTNGRIEVVGYDVCLSDFLLSESSCEGEEIIDCSEFSNNLGDVVCNVGKCVFEQCTWGRELTCDDFSGACGEIELCGQTLNCGGCGGNEVCFNQACVESCSDTDSENGFQNEEKYVKGTVSFNGEMEEDYCSYGNLYEYYCKDDGLGFISTFVGAYGNDVCYDGEIISLEDGACLINGHCDGGPCKTGVCVDETCSYTNRYVGTSCSTSAYNGQCNRQGVCECIESNNGNERCDGKDNDCDGQVDEGNLCGEGMVCLAGQCMTDRIAETRPSGKDELVRGQVVGEVDSASAGIVKESGGSVGFGGGSIRAGIMMSPPVQNYCGPLGRLFGIC